MTRIIVTRAGMFAGGAALALLAGVTVPSAVTASSMDTVTFPETGPGASIVLVDGVGGGYPGGRDPSIPTGGASQMYGTDRPASETQGTTGPSAEAPASTQAPRTQMTELPRDDDGTVVDGINLDHIPQ